MTRSFPYGILCTVTTSVYHIWSRHVLLSFALLGTRPISIIPALQAGVNNERQQCRKIFCPGQIYFPNQWSKTTAFQAVITFSSFFSVMLKPYKRFNHTRKIPIRATCRHGRDTVLRELSEKRVCDEPLWFAILA